MELAQLFNAALVVENLLLFSQELLVFPAMQKTLTSPGGKRRANNSEFDILPPFMHVWTPRFYSNRR